MAFEKFTNTRKWRKAYIPTITIYKSNKFLMNKACYEKYFAGNKYVALFFDETNNRIGFKPTVEAEEHSYKLNAYPEHRQFTIGAISFLKYHNIDTTITKRYPAHWDDEAKLVTIDIT